MSVVSPDWFGGSADARAYSICYVNAFQTQSDDGSVDRPDDTSNWPRDLALERLGDDPIWGGEYLIDLSSADKRTRAAECVQPMIQTCAAKDFKAVEYDNLDSWTRFDGTPAARRVPFGKRQAIAYAELLTDRAHALGSAVAQKNTLALNRRQARTEIGFDFAIAESCGRYSECQAYRALLRNRVIAIENRQRDFRRVQGRRQHHQRGAARPRRDDAELALAPIRRLLSSRTGSTVRRPEANAGACALRDGQQCSVGFQGPRPVAGMTEASPVHVDVVFGELRVGGDDGDLLCEGLGDEESIERVTVVMRESAHSPCGLGVDGERGEPFVEDDVGQVVGCRELAERPLDGDLPDAGGTHQRFVRAVGDRGAGSGRESWIVG